MKFFIFAVFVLLHFNAYANFLDSNIKQTTWRSIIDLKIYNKDYIPQGVTLLGANLLALNVHEKDKRSLILLFNLLGDEAKFIREFELPSDATHTSDLEFYENKIYALDYHSNKIYIIDANSVTSNKPAVLRQIRTNLSGSGSACISHIKGKPYYAMTRFIRSSKIYFIPLETLDKKDEILPKDIEFNIDVNRFIQGLYCYDDRVIASVNTAGEDIIYVYSLDADLKRLNLITSYNAPTEKVEDILIRDKKFITSGEDKDENIFYESGVIDEI